jgi:arabinose-5-phosphate isomerase
MTEYNKRAKEILKEEILSIENLANNIPKDFSLIVDEILKLEGRVIVIGMGKCSYIAMKLSASLASTGTPSFFVHPAEASHGALGMIT